MLCYEILQEEEEEEEKEKKMFLPSGVTFIEMSLKTIL
jgi:hypothetical protein